MLHRRDVELKLQCYAHQAALRQSLGLINESPKHTIGPPSHSRFAVLEVPALAGESSVPVWAEALHTGRHNYGDGDAGIEQPLTKYEVVDDSGACGAFWGTL
jgi:hypothetical protein